MKQLFVLLILTFLIACSNKAEEVKVEDIKENFGNGTTSRTFQRINGKIEGKMIDYYPSGALKGERLFEDNLQAGKTTLYYENGKIMEVQYYSNGLKNGGDTIFYESGLPKFTVFLIDDKKQGYLRKWDEDGSITYEAKFEKDSLVEVKGKKIKN